MARKPVTPQSPTDAPIAPISHAVLPVDALAPHDRNYRRHPDTQLERIGASLTRFSQVRSIVVQQGADGRYLIVAGHGVVEAARRNGLTELRADVLPATWTPQAIEAYLIADNETARGADDDLTLLAEMLQEQANAGESLEALGYNASELEALLAQLADVALAGDAAKRDADDPSGGGDDFDTTPDADGPTRCQPGDLWRLGEHRLLCGDSTNAADVARLMGDDQAQMVWTDPPYGVSYVGGSQDARSPNYRMGRAVPHDNLTQDETEAVVAQALEHAGAHCVLGASAYIASPSGDNLPAFIRGMTSGGFPFRHTLVWVKDSFVFGRTDYHYQHEMILYGWREGAHYWAGDRTLGTVFEIPRPKRSEEHPTMKPVALVAAMLVNSSREGDVVYEPFCGSGTTLITCERLGRKCRAFEISPKFADVILRRWEAETGRTAVRLSSTETTQTDE